MFGALYFVSSEWNSFQHVQVLRSIFRPNWERNLVVLFPEPSVTATSIFVGRHELIGVVGVNLIGSVGNQMIRVHAPSGS